MLVTSLGYARRFTPGQVELWHVALTGFSHGSVWCSSQVFCVVQPQVRCDLLIHSIGSDSFETHESKRDEQRCNHAVETHALVTVRCNADSRKDELLAAVSTLTGNDPGASSIDCMSPSPNVETVEQRGSRAGPHRLIWHVMGSAPTLW